MKKKRTHTHTHKEKYKFLLKLVIYTIFCHTCMYIMNLAFQLFLTMKGGTFWPDILDNQQIPKLTSKPAAETFIKIKLYK